MAHNLLRRYDDFSKHRLSIVVVIAAQAAIQYFQLVVDSGLHRSDGLGTSKQLIHNRLE